MLSAAAFSPSKSRGTAACGRSADTHQAPFSEKSAERAGSPAEIRGGKPEPNGFEIFGGLSVEPLPHPMIR